MAAPAPSPTPEPALPTLPTTPADAVGLVAQLQASIENADWSALLASWGLKLLSVAVVLVVGVWAARKLSQGLARVLERSNADPILVGFLRNIAYFGLLVVVLIAALAQAGVNPASLLAVLGAAGLAIALALKDSLSNFASGVMLILLRPFKAGDYVQIAGLEGTIEQVRVFQTQMRTIDNRVIVLPNSQITTAPIINFTARPTRRVDLVIGVGYDDDLGDARAALLHVADGNERVLKEPAADVLVTGLAESSVQLTLRAWVSTADVLAAKSELLEGIHREIRGRGLSIPYPQRDLHVYHHGAAPAGAAGTARDLVDDGDR
ncbi:MAG: mechanosensitive ion channel family protein [Silanimonas sp.]